MTLVVTTASARGITVVGDRAAARRSGGRTEILSTKKVWFSSNANIALACWGNADLPRNQPLEEWIGAFVDGIQKNAGVETVCERLANQLNPLLDSLERPLSRLRRGIHVSGYENGVPVIFHVHTGDPRAFHHPLRLYRDYPDIHGGGREHYRQFLDSGGFAQLRNGQYELFVTLAQRAFESQRDLSALLGTPVPADTLRGQATFDEALVRFAHGILKSAELPPTVSSDLDVIAFTADGQVIL
jgi:hypothetical protein